MQRLYPPLDPEPRGFPLARSEHRFHRCWAQTPVSAIPAVESRRRREVRVANAFGDFHHLSIDFFFFDTSGFGGRVVFKVVERGPLNAMAFELGRQPVEAELNAVHRIE